MMLLRLSGAEKRETTSNKSSQDNRRDFEDNISTSLCNISCLLLHTLQSFNVNLMTDQE